MAVKGEIAILVSKCVRCMAYYHDYRSYPNADAVMSAEIRFARFQASALGLAEDHIERLVAHPVERNLVARYGNELGHSLFDAFKKEFESAGD